MGKYGLRFISDENLFMHVKATVDAYSANIDLAKFNKNLIDPIKLTFDSKVYGQNCESVIESEVLRQMDKKNSNNIGFFHQNIFRYIGDDWSVPKKGYDVVNLSKKIYCEIKNKHNTMNSSSSAKTYMRMQNTLIKSPKSTCMLVEVIAPSRDIEWEVTVDGEKQSRNKRIRRVSIDKFYAIVTGDENAFSKLCSILPIVIEDVVKSEGFKRKSNSVLSELRAGSEDLLTSLYMLAFKNYDGFSNFKIGNNK